VLMYSCDYSLPTRLPSAPRSPSVGRSWMAGSASACSGIWLDRSDGYGTIAALLQLALLVHVILGDSYSLWLQP
jgi:hypothetical protein